MPIKILPKELINQIAAGEVVERPASVMKELVENALDAGAENIIVELENGGINLIKVTDDGCGMDREDANLCLVEHSTSKISSSEDLYQIKTLGFRGEALSSISAVSEFCLVTKNKESIIGTSLRMENGQVAVADIGAADGTSVEVKNLFYNIPARKKYLKTAVTEFNHIVDLFLNYCLAYPEISWKLIHNAKTVYQFPAAGLSSRIADCLGDDIAANLLPVDLKREGIQVKGYIGLPAIGRNNRKLQYLFINKRPVNEYIISKQVKSAFGTLLARDLHPVYIFDLIIDPISVDVNVHPRKMEVRFSEPQIIYRAIYQIIAGVLDENELERQVSAKEVKGFVPIGHVLEKKQEQIPIKKFNRPNTNSDFSQPKIMSTDFRKAIDNFNQRMVHTADEVRPEVFAEIKNDEPVFVDEYKILGQVQNSYIVAQTEEAIKIYDQHASSERIQYEKIVREWQIGKLASQKLLLPQKIELAPTEISLFESNAELLERLGFEIANFSGNSFAVSAVPRFFVNSDIKQIILQILGELTEMAIVDDLPSGPVEEIFKMMACKSAIKFGDELSIEGMEALVADLEKLSNHYTCVHGRPCAIEFKFSELEKMFKRK